MEIIQCCNLPSAPLCNEMSRILLQPPFVRIDGSTMSSPSVLVNTFVQENNEVYIDSMSKIFVVAEAIFGFFRLPLIQNRKLFYILIALFYSTFLNVTILYFTFMFFHEHYVTIAMVSHTIQYTFCTVFGFICIKKLQFYYSTLNRFDREVGCKPKVSRHDLQNLGQMVLTIIMLFVFFMVHSQRGKNKTLHVIPMHIACTLEINYYGHLLNLLIPRLKLINHFLQSSLSNAKSETSSLMKEFVSLKRGNTITNVGHCRMRKLMDLYHIMVEAYDFLIDAMKWQLLVTIITSFLSILGLLYLWSLNIIKGGQNLIDGVFFEFLLSVLIMTPLFSPCTFGDKVHHEVKRLRELLASRLYENKLDKSGRSIARALLAFTETRDLSFRLLRMLNIDISLPFKFMGLLVTYLIILLQFEKVINPGTDVVPISSNKSVS